MWINFLSYENPFLSALFKKAFSMTLADSFNYLRKECKKKGFTNRLNHETTDM